MFNLETICNAKSETSSIILIKCILNLQKIQLEIRKNLVFKYIRILRFGYLFLPAYICIDNLK